MAASGFTPISLYYSTTAAAAPSAGNLTNGELAINITDGKLYYKDNAGVVQLLASKAALTSVDSISFGTTGLTPATATTGAVTVAGTLITSNGGTGLSSYTAGDLPYYASGTALSKLGIGTSNQILTSSGTAPQWTNGSSISVGTANNLAGGLAGSVPYQSSAGTTTFLSIGTSGYVLQSNGTAPTWVAASSVVGGAAGLNTQIQYNNSGALAGSANFIWDNANARLGISTASPTYQLDINNASSYSTIGLRQGGTLYGYVEGGSAQVKLGSATAIPIILEPNGTEQVRVLSSGAVSFGSSGTAYGTSGQVLTSAGSSSAPTWETPTGITTGKSIAMAMIFGF